MTTKGLKEHIKEINDLVLSVDALIEERPPDQRPERWPEARKLLMEALWKVPREQGR